MGMETALLGQPLMERWADRIAAARRQLRAVWLHENHDRPAWILSSVNYALCGQRDIPDRYFDPVVMTKYQLRKIVRHMEAVPDDYVPVLHPWYGTTVVPSALGVPVVCSGKLDPSLGAPILKCPEDILKLKKPDPERDGQMPEVLRCIDFMKSATDVPVCVTDTQGPLNIALSLAGASNLFIWMYEEPEAVHALMAFCTEVLIDWVKIQKKHAEQAWNGGAYPHAIEIPDGFGGVAFSDDDVTAIGCEQYRVFAVPYNERVLAAFGGGSVHFCGSAHHQLDTLTRMTGLFAVNNFCMGDFSQIRRLQERIPSPGALMACDFNAADIPWHRSRLASLAERPEGLVLAVFVSPGMALLDSGKYAASDRSEEEILSAYSRPF